MENMIKTTAEIEKELQIKMVPPFSLGDNVTIVVRRTWGDPDFCQYKLLAPVKDGVWLAYTDEDCVPEDNKILEIEECDIIDFTEEMQYKQSAPETGVPISKFDFSEWD